MKRTVLVLVVAVLFAMVFSGCDLISTSDPVLTSISVDKTSVAVSVSSTATVTATAYDENLEVMDGVELTWASADETVATVANGVITGVGNGSTTVSVSSGEISKDVSVTVRTGSNPGGGLYTETYFDLGETTLGVWSENGGSAPVLSQAPAGVGSVDGSIALQVDFSGIGAWGGLYWQNDSGLDGSAFAAGDLVFSIRTSSAARVGTFSTFNIKIEDTAGGANEIALSDVVTTSANGEWTEYRVKVTDFTNVDMSKFKALGFWNPDVLQTIYMDKIYFDATSSAETTIVAQTEPTEGPTAPSDDTGKNYIPLYTGATFTNTTSPAAPLSVPGWWTLGTIADVTAGSETVKKLSGSAESWYPLEFNVDGSSMTNMSISVYTSSATEIKIKLVDFGGDGYQGESADTEHELTINATSTPALSGAAQWVTLDIPLSDFTSMAGKTQLSQLIITSTSDLYFDDLYFHN